MKASQESDRIRLKHMVDAISEALSFIEGRTREDLNSNRMLVLALLKELELIGEAASKISDESKQKLQEVPWSILVATRNRLIHGYFDINLDIVWATINQDLRELLQLLRAPAED